MEPENEPGTSQRFAFGKNWRRFLEHVDEERIAAAEDSLQRLLRQQDLIGLTFLDVGCGSGLFSLAARRLGAQRIHSFDFDAQSVACTRELRRRFATPSPSTDDGSEEGAKETLSGWTVEQGDILDAEYRDRLPVADVVYSWGVLHHTGSMWRALEAAAELVAPEGLLCIAIYNQQPFLTGYWKVVKRLYNRLPRPLAWCLSGAYYLFSSSVLLVADVLRARSPLARHRGAGPRGMNHYHDVVDWIGGWPFEAAKPEEIFRFFRDRGFTLQELTTCGGRHGCNEFLFRRHGS